ncbi:MAG TPA: pentapeptide repeat-containing protein [Flavobacterium sp.]|nr:pentapeptide repeat-containing protein [Flavobacterium sp.]
MTQYFLDIEFDNLIFGETDVNLKEFECCTFNSCDFSQCNFIGVVLIDCTFNNCIFSGAKINHVALRTVLFYRCKIEDVNFAMCDKLIFEVHFKECILDFSKFYTLKIKGTSFVDCSLIAVDFMNTDLTEVLFDNCDLYRSEFSKANASKGNFKSSYNYTIDPTKTKIKKAIFSLSEVKGLLYKHNIIVN